MARSNQREATIGWTVCLEDENGALHTCELRDVSDDGVFVLPLPNNNGFEPGQRVRILIQAGDVKLHVGGEVRWVGASDAHEVDGFGVKLDDMPNPVASALGLGHKSRAKRFAG
ncbi:MAG: PilZ domain-containing protein [Myxococcales bacterium]|nr:PilZ domain-containing protein [Myxococcales bacterium]